MDNKMKNNQIERRLNRVERRVNTIDRRMNADRKVNDRRKTGDRRSTNVDVQEFWNGVESVSMKKESSAVICFMPVELVSDKNEPSKTVRATPTCISVDFYKNLNIDELYNNPTEGKQAKLKKLQRDKELGKAKLTKVAIVTVGLLLGAAAMKMYCDRQSLRKEEVRLSQENTLRELINNGMCPDAARLMLRDRRFSRSNGKLTSDVDKSATQ